MMLFQKLAGFLLVAVLLTGCVVLNEKETLTIFGCTDRNAPNFIEEATQDDGSCNPNRRVVLYSLGNWADADDFAESVIITYQNESVSFNVGSYTPSNLDNCDAYQTTDAFNGVLEIPVGKHTVFCELIYEEFNNSTFTYDRRKRTIEKEITVVNNGASCQFIEI